MKTFETEFPSLKGKKTDFVEVFGEVSFYDDDVIMENCLDKAKVREARQDIFKIIDLEQQQHKRICQKHCDLPFDDIKERIDKLLKELGI